jgi:hypothetical protein
VVLAWLVLSPLAFHVWYLHPIHIEVYPAQALTVRAAQSTLELNETVNKIPYSEQLTMLALKLPPESRSV